MAMVSGFSPQPLYENVRVEYRSRMAPFSANVAIRNTFLEFSEEVVQGLEDSRNLPAFYSDPGVRNGWVRPGCDTTLSSTSAAVAAAAAAATGPPGLAKSATAAPAPALSQSGLENSSRSIASARSVVLRSPCSTASCPSPRLLQVFQSLAATSASAQHAFASSSASASCWAAADVAGAISYDSGFQAFASAGLPAPSGSSSSAAAALAPNESVRSSAEQAAAVIAARSTAASEDSSASALATDKAVAATAAAESAVGGLPLKPAAALAHTTPQMWFLVVQDMPAVQAMNQTSAAHVGIAAGTNASNTLRCGSSPSASSGSSGSPSSFHAATVPQQRPRQQRNHLPLPKFSAADTRTTVMLQNLPNCYTQDMLIEMLDSEGYRGCYNFVYLPMDYQTRACFGYAFVNLVSPGFVPSFWSRFNGYTKWALPSRKTCSVTWCTSHQGLDALIDRYRSSPLMHSSVLEEHRPVIFEKGLRVRFPSPKRAPRAPRPPVNRALRRVPPRG
eukprot:TRINITY_DN37235_c0_g1_i1.p1 TRINITY_DN37235_c0_g1~~TRINITY_DN37235_c0_g1_i1.p1  ORF type:complete len:505 (+),score=84.68 TRINITY_DN37235_c0_g1_i1:95-1609(+)